MLRGFLDGAPSTVGFTDDASSDVYMGVPFAVRKWREDTHRSCFTMWETDRLPWSFIRTLGWFDQIIVPCDANLELFSQHHKQVVKVPLGFDPTVWCPGERSVNDKFVFAGGGSLWKRKGMDVLVQAFLKADLPDTELRLKIAPHARDIPSIPSDPRIRVFREWMDLDETVRFTRDADCWVAPARGEGFGLMPLQAIACGTPTILSETTGHLEFSHHAVMTSPVMKQACHTGRWDEPNVVVLADRMREMYNNASMYRTLAEQKAVSVKEEFTWRQAAEKLLAAVPRGSRTSGKETYAPIETMVTVTKLVNANIAGKQWKLEPGQHLIPEGVFQVLFDAGVIKPA